MRNTQAKKQCISFLVVLFKHRFTLRTTIKCQCYVPLHRLQSHDFQCHSSKGKSFFSPFPPPPLPRPPLVLRILTNIPFEFQDHFISHYFFRSLSFGPCSLMTSFVFNSCTSFFLFLSFSLFSFLLFSLFLLYLFSLLLFLYFPNQS